MVWRILYVNSSELFSSFEAWSSPVANASLLNTFAIARLSTISKDINYFFGAVTIFDF